MIFSPGWFRHQVTRRIQQWYISQNSSNKGVAFCAPGHFYWPLLNLENLEDDGVCLLDDGEEYWEHINLRLDAQREYFQSLLSDVPCLDFPEERNNGFRYYARNPMFPYSDAFTLSNMIIKERPKRVIEVGSRFSSAVMLDSLDRLDIQAKLTFIEPYPDRLNSLLRPQDHQRIEVLAQPVQQVAPSRFK